MHWMVHYDCFPDNSKICLFLLVILIAGPYDKWITHSLENVVLFF